MAAALVLFGGCGGELLPVKTVRMWSKSYASLAPADMDGDSTDELVAVYYDGVVQPLDQTPSSVIGTAPCPMPQDEIRDAQVWGDSSGRVAVSYRRHDSVFIRGLWPNRELLVATGPSPSIETSVWRLAVSRVVFTDLTGDGRVECLVGVAAGRGLGARGIHAFEWETGRHLLFYEMGPAIGDVRARDIDADSRKEILAGSQALGNGVRANGTTDESSYVFLLDADGHARWIASIGHFSSQVNASWLSTDSTAPVRILAWEDGSGTSDRTGDSLYVLTADSGRIVHRARHGGYARACVVDSRRAIGVCIATGGTDDTIRLLDDSLRVRKRVAAGGRGVTHMLAGAFSKAGARELLAATSNGAILVLDWNLRLLSRGQMPPGCAVEDVKLVRFHGRNRLLTRADVEDKRAWMLYDFVPDRLLSRRVALGWILISAVFMVSAFAALLIGLRVRQTRNTRTLIRSLTGQAGVVELDRRGHVRRANSKGRELLQAAGATQDAPLTGALAPLGNPAHAGKEPRELPLSLPSGQTVLARTIAVKSGLLLTLEDISAVEYMKRVTSWAPVAQKLAHDIKNPLTAMALTLQRLDKHRNPETDRYYTSMKDEIDRLKKMADGFMRLSKLEPPKLAPGSINDLVRSCLAKFDNVKPPGVSIVCDLADDLPMVALDPDQLSVACSNIIENAISAMGDAGALVIGTSFIVADKRVAVSVRDSGKGIPERYLDKVFKPYFTLKPGGTGLGMAITKRIIDDHKGTIAIQSKEGEGTTVTITLPVTTPHA